MLLYLHRMMNTSELPKAVLHFTVAVIFFSQNYCSGPEFSCFHKKSVPCALPIVRTEETHTHTLLRHSLINTTTVQQF